jgi:hypothetical protein
MRGMRPLVAHCHLGLGRICRRTGKHQEAGELLTSATAMYRGMDMGYWEEQAVAEVAALGSDARSQSPSRWETRRSSEQAYPTADEPLKKRPGCKPSSPSITPRRRPAGTSPETSSTPNQV